MPELHSSRRLDRPRPASLRRPRIDPDSFAYFSERVARFLGTGRYLLIQTIIVAIWMGLNVTAVVWRFDPYPFILLNLVFSAQAAYAAPLILFAQYRQSGRDRISLGEDRDRAERIHADTDFLARELAVLRIATLLSHQRLWQPHSHIRLPPGTCRAHLIDAQPRHDGA